ncbi:MAG: hypothetical protein IPK79_09665 [Vampirovibrionales bacterium]|nr:hypothetical protein [Vampirovibrionales bacterium]
MTRAASGRKRPDTDTKPVDWISRPPDLNTLNEALDAQIHPKAFFSRFCRVSVVCDSHHSNAFDGQGPECALSQLAGGGFARS